MGRDRSDLIVAFEILSPSTEDRDLRWKRIAYTSLASLTDYVVIAQDSTDVVVFSRDAGNWLVGGSLSSANGNGNGVQLAAFSPLGGLTNLSGYTENQLFATQSALRRVAGELCVVTLG